MQFDEKISGNKHEFINVADITKDKLEPDTETIPGTFQMVNVKDNTVTVASSHNIIDPQDRSIVRKRDEIGEPIAMAQLKFTDPVGAMTQPSNQYSSYCNKDDLKMLQKPKDTFHHEEVVIKSTKTLRFVTFMTL